MKLRCAVACWTVVACVNTRGLADELSRFATDRPVDCLHIKLELNVDIPGKHVGGTAYLDIAALREVSTITLDAVDLNTTAAAITYSGRPEVPVEYINDGKEIQILLERPLSPGDRATIRIDYSIDDPADGLHFYAPSENEPDVPYVVWSQGESTDNSHWFPCFDQPNERQTTELVITTERGYQVSSNGRLISKKEDAQAGTVTFHWLQDKPHPTYLVSLIVGEFHVERDTWRGKPVTYWAHPRFKDDIKRSFRNTIRMLDFFSDSIGIEYPWDRYAQICCEGFGGGMENTSATTLGNRALHDERSALDDISDGLIAHELAHQWWGDLLTCREWAHLWLNEGFASYFEALWNEYDLGDDEFQYNMFRKANRAKRGGKKAPIVDRAYKTAGSMFDSRAYPKGAWVLHMLRRRLGDDLFWKAINKYGSDNAYKSVETVDLRKAVDKVTGRSFERFFYDWTERPGHPEVTVQYKWLNEERLANVFVKQTQEAGAFHFPLTIEFRFGDDQPPVTVTRELTEKELNFYYPLPKAPQMVRVDPGQTVLMELKEKKGKDLWKRQLLDDTDPIARIRAAEHFGESKTDADRKLLAEALQSEQFWGVQREIAKALGESGGDVARDALIAGLQLEHRKARRACLEQLGSFHQDQVAIDAIRPIVEKGDPIYSVEAAAIETFGKLEPEGAIGVLKKVLKRDSRFEIIRSAALTGLGSLRNPEVVPLLAEWTRPNKPRRCRPSAIRALAKATTQMHVEEEAMQMIVASLEECLSDTGRRVRSAASRALGALSEPAMAKPALPALRALAANDASEWVRRTAEKSIEAIESGKPAQIQLAELREDLKSAQEQYDELIERFEKLESRVSDSPQGTESDVKEVASTGSDQTTGKEE